MFGRDVVGIVNILVVFSFIFVDGFGEFYVDECCDEFVLFC